MDHAGQERPLLWELPFWAGLTFWALYPSLQTPWFEVATIPVSSKDVVAFGLTIFYTFHALASAAVRRRAALVPVAWGTRHALGAPHLLMFTVGIAAYAAVSTLWSGTEARDRTAMLYTLLATANSAALGYLLIAHRSAASTQAFLWRLTLFLAGLGLIYSAESAFSLGLRSEMGHQQDYGDFGIQRVRGPLFAASTGYLVLLPAIAFAVQRLSWRRGRRALVAVVLVALLLAMAGLGSRAGFLLLGLYVLLLMCASGRHQRGVVGLVALATLLAMTLVFSAADPTRLQFTAKDLGEEGRVANHITSWYIAANRSLAANFLGSGYGSQWPWYLPDVELGSMELYDLGLYTDWVPNAFGPLLYHPHSVFLLLAVELGAFGVLYFTVLLMVPLQLLADSVGGGRSALFCIGVAVSGLSLFGDLFLFRSFQLSAVWWMFVFGAMALGSDVAESIGHPATSLGTVFQRIMSPEGAAGGTTSASPST
jgi:hypothetical protein